MANQNIWLLLQLVLNVFNTVMLEYGMGFKTGCWVFSWTNTKLAWSAECHVAVPGFSWFFNLAYVTDWVAYFSLFTLAHMCAFSSPHAQCCNLPRSPFLGRWFHLPPHRKWGCSPNPLWGRHKSRAELGVLQKSHRHFCATPGGARLVHRHAPASPCPLRVREIGGLYRLKLVRIATWMYSMSKHTLPSTIINCTGEGGGWSISSMNQKRGNGHGGSPSSWATSEVVAVVCAAVIGVWVALLPFC